MKKNLKKNKKKVLRRGGLPADHRARAISGHPSSFFSGVVF